MRLQHTTRLRRDKIRDRKRKKRIWTLSIIAIVLVALVWFVFLSGVFKVEKIKISESKFLSARILEKDLEEFLVGKSTSKNMIFTSRRDFKDLFNNYPQIKDFDLKKNWKDKIIDLNIYDHEPIGVLYQEGDLEKSFYFNQKGFIFSEAQSQIEDPELIVKDNSGRFYELGDILLAEDDFKYFLKIKEKLSEEFSFIHFYFNKEGLSAILRPIQLEKSHTWSIIIDQADLKRTLAVLTNLIRGDFFVENDNLEYLDLRYLPNVYYKKM